MFMANRRRSLLLLGAALLPAFPAAAQTSPAAADPAIAPAPQAKEAGKKGVYTPADFARFAPKTAYDMLIQVPGFTIISPSQFSLERGLGQAYENVIINGERISNKTGGAVDELHRISAANVERIEIVDAASLGIAGLSGQVANVIVKDQKKASGQFEWNPNVRAHYARPNLFNGSISYSGSSGPVDYTLSVKDQAGRGAFGGPVIITDRNGVVTERRNEVFHSESELVTFQTKFRLDGPGSSVGNLTLGYTPYWAPFHLSDDRDLVSGDDRSRTTVGSLDGWYYDVNADYEFALGPGRLKLIGLRHRDHEPVVTTQITTFDSGADPNGIRFSRDSVIQESVGRGEYSWKTGKNSWQFSFERAFNALDQKGGLFVLNPQGQFDEIDFPEGTGKVSEVRYEGITTLSRPLSSKLDLQIAGGGEISTLDRVDDDAPPRKFFRPKGSLILGWRPAKGWDASLKLRRRVGQISFYDFLAQPKLADDRENAGNPDLVPPQSWELEGEVGREFGAWGKTRLRAWNYWVQDIIDVIPLKNHGEGIGNLPRATRWGLESNSTINFDPIGWTGAKLDAQIGFEQTRVKDPLTGERRPISGIQDFWYNLSLRHDIPHTKLAWGADFSYGHYTQNYFLTEVFRNWEGPNWLSLYVEDKNVMGLDVRFSVQNVLNARHRWYRTVYEDWRSDSPVAFIQDNNQLIGPIFKLNVKGSF
jgi:outer membrane receptor for ferrienterochelin and colicins